jgi:hypothetical protein
MVAIPIVMAVILGANVPSAHAITRPEVLKRAHSWIKKRVPYSQSSYYQGYRQDCSGFVSMAWKLKSSYTSSSIQGTARKVKMSKLQPGDAVRRPGHVEIFGGWKNLKKRQYWALEESTWGQPALRRVKTFKSGYTALRLRGIQEVRVPVKPPAPATPPTPSVPTTPSVPATGSVSPTGSASATQSVGASSGVSASIAAALTPSADSALLAQTIDPRSISLILP